jgi:hypothetical protein
MRKFAVVGLVVLGLFAVAGIAYAATPYANTTYTSTSKITPSKSGTPAKPTPVAAALTFHSASTAAGTRPAPIETYSIGLGPGVVPNTSVAPGCAFAKTNPTVKVLSAKALPAACRGKAVIGSGNVEALAGPTNDANSALTSDNPPGPSAKCHLDVTLINQTKKNHFTVRVDTIDGLPVSNPKFCGLAVHQGIDATLVKTGSAPGKKGGKLPIWAIRFSVPKIGVLHPLGGVDSSVITNVSNVKRISKKLGKVTHGYFESIGCPKTSAKQPAGKRSADVTFTSELGQKVTVSSTSPCS